MAVAGALLLVGGGLAAAAAENEEDAPRRERRAGERAAKLRALLKERQAAGQGTTRRGPSPEARAGSAPRAVGPRRSHPDRWRLGERGSKRPPRPGGTPGAGSPVLAERLLSVGDQFQVNSVTTGPQYYPSVATDGSQFVVVWNGLYDPTGAYSPTVEGQRFATDGTPAGGEFQVNSDPGSFPLFPGFPFPPGAMSAVATGPGGAFVVVWTSYGSSGTDTDALSVQARQFAADGTPAGPELQVNTYTTDLQWFPDVAVGPGGEFVVVWQSYGSSGTDSYYSIQGQRFLADGTPTGGEFQVNTYTPYYQYLPAVSIGPGGEFVVVWQSDYSPGSDSYYSIQGQRFSAAGAADGPQFQVNSYTPGIQLVPDVAVGPLGEFVVVWHSYYSPGTDLDFSVLARGFAADGTPAAGDFQVNSYTTGYQGYAQVAKGPGGEFVVAWESYGSAGTDTDISSIQARELAADGTPSGDDFQVNTATTYYQLAAAIAAGSGGQFVVAWDSDVSPGTDSDYASIQARRLCTQADLAVTKDDGTLVAVPGLSLVYTIEARNDGPCPVAAATVSDSFPAGLGCGWTSVEAGGASGNTDNAGPAALADVLALPAGGSVTYTVTCAVDPAATGALVNTATIAGAAAVPPDPDPSNDSATDSDTVLVPEADLAITKSDGATSAVPGQSLVYTIAASNNGPSSVGAVSVADAFPSELSCSWTSVAVGGASGNSASSGDLADLLSMPAGSSVTYTVSCTIDPAATGTLSNTATITSPVTDPTPANNSADDTDTLLVPEADLTVTKDDGGAAVVPGTQFTYTLTVTNGGPSDSTGGTVSDPLPAGLTFVSSASGCTEAAGTVSCPFGPLGSGGSVMLSFVVAVDPAQAIAISNTATVAGNEADPDTSDDSFTQITPLAGAEADLAITKSDGTTSAVPGQSLVYTITASNGGPSSVDSVSLTDTFPAQLSCSWTSIALGGASGNSAGTGDLADVLSMPIGSSVIYTVSCGIDPSAIGTLSNTATISSPFADPTPGNDSATDGDTILVPEADLSVMQTADPDPVAAGGNLVYTIDVINNGASTATSVVVTNTLSPEVTPLSASGAGWTVNPPLPRGEEESQQAGGVLSFTRPSLAPGLAPPILIEVEVDEEGSSTVTNLASVAAAEPDLAGGNNSSTLQVQVNPPVGIPTLGRLALWILLATLAAAALPLLRR